MVADQDHHTDRIRLTVMEDTEVIVMALGIAAAPTARHTEKRSAVVVEVHQALSSAALSVVSCVAEVQDLSCSTGKEEVLQDQDQVATMSL